MQLVRALNDIGVPTIRLDLGRVSPSTGRAVFAGRCFLASFLRPRLAAWTLILFCRPPTPTNFRSAIIHLWKESEIRRASKASGRTTIVLVDEGPLQWLPTQYDNDTVLKKIVKVYSLGEPPTMVLWVDPGVEVSFARLCRRGGPGLVSFSRHRVRYRRLATILEVLNPPVMRACTKPGADSVPEAIAHEIRRHIHQVSAE